MTTEYPPNDVPYFVFWLMPDEDPLYEDWPHSTVLRAWHRGRCGMCQVGDWFDNHLVVDHDHDTGLIRGLLCRGCNSSEPHNDTAAFAAWTGGLNTATVLGMIEEYQSPLGFSARRPTRTASEMEAVARKIALAVTR